MLLLGASRGYFGLVFRFPAFKFTRAIPCRSIVHLIDAGRAKAGANFRGNQTRAIGPVTVSIGSMHC